MIRGRRRPPAPLARLLRARPRDWADLARAQWALLRAEIDVRRRPTGSLVTASRGGPPPTERTASSGGSGSSGLPPPTKELCARLSRAVQVVARHGPFHHGCLVRALALQRLLARHGLEGSTVRVGVRREGEALTAHAWVEYREVVLGDSVSRVRSFAQLEGLDVIP